MLPSLLVMLVLVELGLPLLLFLFRDRVVFLPSAWPSPEDGLRLLTGRAHVELVWIPRPDGRRLAAYEARPLAGNGSEAAVVLFFHGNAGNIGGRGRLLEDFVVGTGAQTLLFDYSGYGGNEGTPSEAEALRDGQAAYDFLVSEGVSPRRIVFYGESLGAAIAIALAHRNECAGVVAQSAFSSLSSMALRAYPWLPLVGLLAKGGFPSAEVAGDLEAPLLVVHGERDRIVPIAEGKRLYESAKPGTEFVAVKGAGHNDFLEVAGTEYLTLLSNRMATWVAGDP